MATLDDKILGEKLQNYCSSSSDDEDDCKQPKGAKFIPEAQVKDQEALMQKGISTNTGPKGVIKDWQRFKQLEHEKNLEAQQERTNLAKKLAMTCKSDDLDKELKPSEGASNKAQTEQEAMEQDLGQDEFFQQYMKQKMAEMQSKSVALPRFANVTELTNDMFLNEIDKENKNVTIVVHIYDHRMSECRQMNDCLDIICKEYAIVKFCKVKSTEINLSDKFRKTGCPALLVYKGGELIGNFVKLGEEFGDEFCSSDVENFLIEQGFLPSADLPTSIRSSIAASSVGKNANDDDSDD